MSERRTSSRNTQRHDYRQIHLHGTTSRPQSAVPARASRDPSRHSEDQAPSRQSSIHSPTASEQARREEAADFETHQASQEADTSGRDNTRYMPGSLPDEVPEITRVDSRTSIQSPQPVPAWAYRMNVEPAEAGPSGRRRVNVTLDAISDPEEPTIIQPSRIHPLTGTIVRSLTNSATGERVEVPFIRPPLRRHRIQDPLMAIPAPMEQAPPYEAPPPQVPHAQAAQPNQVQQLINDISLRINQDAQRRHNEVMQRLEAVERTIRRLETNTDDLENAILGNNRRIGEAITNSHNTHNTMIRLEPHVATISGRLTTIDLQNDNIQNTLHAQGEALENLSAMIQGLDGRVQEELESREENESRRSERPEYHPPPHESPSFDLNDQRQSTRVHNQQDEIPKGARAKKPEPFNGKRGREAELFIMRMEIYFLDYPTAFNDVRKITTTLTNMAGGEGGQWAQSLMKDYLSGTPHEYLQNWASFKRGFLAVFSDPIKKERAVRDLKKLTQTGSASAYATTFRTLSQEVDWNESALIDQFKQGLKNTVQTSFLQLALTNPRDMTLEETIQFAVRADDTNFQGRTLGNQTGNSKPNDKGKGTATGERRDNANWVPKEVIDKRKSENRCLKCGKIGHRIKECRSKTYQKEDPVAGKAGEVKEEGEKTESTSSEN
jgi:hypothetical protein